MSFALKNKPSISSIPRKTRGQRFVPRCGGACQSHLTAAIFSLAMLLGLTVLPQTVPAYEPAEKPDYQRISQLVTKLLERDHFSREQLDDEMSQEILDRYLKNLDYNRLYFQQSQIDQFKQKYGTRLDDMVKAGDLSAAQEIYGVFKKNVKERVEKINALLEKDYTFTSDRTVQPSRKDAAWPASSTEADELWERRIEGELLQLELSDDMESVIPTPAPDGPLDETLPAENGAGSEGSDSAQNEEGATGDNADTTAADDEDTPKDPKEFVRKRYDIIVKEVEKNDESDVAEIFLSVVAQTYDPHSVYMSHARLTNFQIAMELKLEGIGAMLRADEDHARVVELVPGGPAERQGELQVNDKIIAVAQGEGAFQDVLGWQLDDIVQLIRGEADSVVRLRVIPAKAVDPSERKEISIIRGEVELKQAAASAQLRVHKDEATGETQRIGWITIPSFYADLQGGGIEDTDRTSTTSDVRILLNRLKEERIDGLVIDLTQNGGGSLEEAIDLTGLFIGKGPVVQVKNPNDIIRTYKNMKSDQIYDGPMVVLVDRSSASASEIFAGALQDYKRAVVVGDSNTFGKGTVQTMLYLDKEMPFWERIKNAGALKLTVQKFYRVAGGSTQLRGVKPDIVLPSPYDYLEYGERALENPLPYDTVRAADFGQFADGSLHLDDLKTASEQRVAQNLGFELLQAESERMKEQEDTNLLSLNLEKRRERKEADQKLVKERNKQLQQLAKSDDIIYSITLDNVEEEKLYLADAEETGSTANKEAKEKLNAETEAERQQKAEQQANPETAQAEGTAETEVEQVAENDAAAGSTEDQVAATEDEEVALSDDFTYSHFMKEEAVNVLLDLINLQENKPKTAGIN